MADKILDNGTLLALGLVGVVAAAGALSKRGSMARSMVRFGTTTDASEAADILKNFMGLVGNEPSSYNKKQWDAAHKALKSKDVAAIYKAFIDLEQSEGGEPPDDNEDMAGHWDDLKRGMRKFKQK